MRPEATGRWPLLAMFAGLQALGFADRFLLALLATPVARTLGVDDFRMGVLQGPAFVVPFVVFTPVFGVVVDRVGAGVPVLLGMLLTTSAVAGCAAANGFPMLLGARVLLGVGEAAIAPAALVEIARAAAVSRAGLGTGLFAAGGPLGKGLVLTAGGALLALCTRVAGPLEPWREVAWTCAGLNLAVLAMVGGRVLRRRAASEPAGRGPAPSRAPPERAGDAFRLAAVAAAGVATVLASQTAANWAPSLFVRGFGLSAAQAGLATGTPLLVLAPAIGVAVGWRLDRTSGRGAPPRSTLAWLAAGLAAAAAAALALRAAPDAPAAQLAFAVLTGLLAATAVCALRVVQLSAGEAVRGRVVAGYIAIANLVGFGLGPPLVGRLAGRIGLADALAAVLVGACLAGAAAIVPLLLLSPLRSLPGLGGATDARR